MHFVKRSAADVTNLEKKLQGGQDFGFNDIEKPALLSVVEPTATKHLIFDRSAGTKTEQTLRSAQYRESWKSVNQQLCCQWPARLADQWEDLIFQKLVRINRNNAMNRPNI